MAYQGLGASFGAHSLDIGRRAWLRIWLVSFRAILRHYDDCKLVLARGGMRKKVVVGAVLIILPIIAAVACPAIHRRRDLKETLAWIDQTYNPHEGGDILGHGHGWERHYTPDPDRTETLAEEYQTTVVSHGGCKVTIRSETLAVGIWKEIPSEHNYSFDLHDIDPNSIAIKTFDPYKDATNCQDAVDVKDSNLQCTDAEIVFFTRNGAPAIKDEYVRTFTKLKGADHEQRGTSKQQEMWLLVDDSDYAQRLARAWKHAIELCGGKASKF